MANTYRELLAALVSLPDAALDSPIVVSDEDTLCGYYAARFAVFAPSVIYDDNADGPVIPVIEFTTEDALYDENDDEVISAAE